MRFLYDLPEDVRRRYEEVLADPNRREGRVGKPGENQPSARGCGTRAGYSRHRRKGEEACNACKAAENEYRKARYARKIAV